MPRESAGYIAEQLSIPIYGIGAGDRVDGQLVIISDMCGMFFDFKSKFVKKYCDAGLMIENGLREYCKEVRGEQFPSDEHFYEIKEEELERLLEDPRWKYDTTDAKLNSHSF